MPQERTAEEVSRDQIREYRRIVGAAVAEVRSQEVRDSYASISLEELTDVHIARLEGPSDQLRPCRSEQIKTVRDELVNAIEAIKAIPPSAFRRRDPDSDVNTDPDGG